MKRYWIGFAFSLALVAMTAAILNAGLQGPGGGGRGAAAPAAPAGPPAPVPPAVAIQRPPAEANSAIAPVQTGPRNDQRHNAFVNTAKTGDFDILFEGDSITDSSPHDAYTLALHDAHKHSGD